MARQRISPWEEMNSNTDDKTKTHLEPREKVYWTTAVGFFLFTALFMVLQLMFFEPYSLRVRANELEKGIPQHVRRAGE